jgi:hypothetical protein
MAEPVSYDDIKPGAVFEPSDFANSYYLPGGKYEALEVLEKGDDDYRVLYHGRDEYDDSIQVIEREQLLQMLGLETVGKNPLGETEVEKAMEEAVEGIGDEERYLGEYAGTRIYAKASLNVSKAMVYRKAASAPTVASSGGWEAVDGLRIKSKDGMAVEVHADAW